MSSIVRLKGGLHLTARHSNEDGGGRGRDVSSSSFL